MRFQFTRRFFSPFWQSALFLLLLPMLELFVMLQFIGIWFTLSSMFFCGLFGILVARREGSRHWTGLKQQLDRGEIPTMHAINGMLVLLAVPLLIVPGLLTSLFGLLLLFPLTRMFVAAHLQLQLEAQRMNSQKENVPRSPEVIDI